MSYYGYNVFLYFAQISGAITLFAAACTLARMQKSNELVGIMAAGTSLYRVAVPVVLVGLATNLLWVIDQEVVIPLIAPKLARAHEDVEGDRARNLYFVEDRGYVDTPLFERAGLPAGACLEGPAIIEQPDTTVVVYPGQICTVDTTGNLIIRTPAEDKGGI